MSRARIAVAICVCVAVLVTAVLLGVLGGSLTEGPDRIAAIEDTFALAAEPEHSAGDQVVLVAGGYAGGAAVSYLKFDVQLPEGRLPNRSWLWLGRYDGPLPDLVELTAVPDTAWQEARVNGGRSPRLGKVIGSLAPGRYDEALAFDVTEVIRASGSYAFAVTAPTSTEQARFVAREATGTSTGAPTITLEWPEPSPPAPDPSASGSPAPAHSQPVLRPTASPVVTPWPAMSASATVSYTAPPPGSAPGSPSGSAAPGSPSPEPVSPEPVSPEPVSPEPVSPEPVSPEPVSPEPVSPEPVSPEPVSPEPSTSEPSSPAASAPTAKPGMPVVCEVADLLVPTCGALTGVAPAAHTRRDRIQALFDWEKRVTRPQAIYHAYHRGEQLFPTADQIMLARDEQQPRLLFLNWKPKGASWGQIAAGNRRIDAYLDSLARHIQAVFPEPFFFTMHHEPENDVIERPDSGMTAKDYAAAFRYVVQRLRANGVSNMVTTMCYMAYVPWNTKPWFGDLYPGDDVVDWISWDAYAYSEPGYGYGDFAELMNRRSGSRPHWPGFYNWAARTFPDKPLMVAEWGVWHSRNNPGHQAAFFESVRLQLELFPRIKALVYFESPNAEGRDSRIDVTPSGLNAYRELSRHPAFDVRVPAEIALRQPNGVD